MRTTSSLESLNSVLRRMFPNHPNLFKFLERLQYHEFGKQIDMNILVQTNSESDDPQLKIPRYRERDENIKACLKKLLDEEEMFNTGDFLTLLSNKSCVPDIGKNDILLCYKLILQYLFTLIFNFTLNYSTIVDIIYPYGRFMSNILRISQNFTYDFI